MRTLVLALALVTAQVNSSRKARPPRDHVLEHSIVKRQSTAPPPES